MHLIYIAGPYSAPTPDGIKANCDRARACGRNVASVPGCFPLIPHQLGAAIEDIGDYAYWIAATLEVMRRCDAVFVVYPHATSKGTHGEIEEAKRLRMPVFYVPEDLASWASRK